MTHDPGCRLQLALACPVGVECDHGYDVCPTCDPCECKTDVQRALEAAISSGSP